MKKTIIAAWLTTCTLTLGQALAAPDGGLLMAPASSGDSTTFDVLLQQQSKDSIFAQDERKKTALMHAALKQHPHIIQALFARAKELKCAPEAIKNYINVQNDKGWTALNYAAFVGDLDTVKLLIAQGANINHNAIGSENPKQTGTPLLMALDQGYLNVANYLLECETLTTVDTVNAVTGQSPLMLAAQQGDTESVRQLLDKKAKTQYFDTEGKTALIYAAINGDTQSLTLLLEHMDRNLSPEEFAKTLNHVTDEKNNSALMYAVAEGHVQATQKLLEYNPDLTQKDDDGDSLLHIALKKKNKGTHRDSISILERLVFTRMIPITSTDKIGQTPLHIVAEQGCFEALCILMRGEEARIAIQQKNKKGKTPLGLAVDECMKNELRKYGAR